MSKAKIISLFCLCGLLVTSIAFSKLAIIPPGSAYQDAITVARNGIQQAMDKGTCGSATVAIMDNGNIVYAEGFGMANREASIPVDQNTMFNIGSVSKVYVAAAIMLLVDDGLVSLDKPVTDYLPEFTMADSRYKAITVRMLLNHTSGFPGSEDANTLGFKYNENTLQETLNTLVTAHLKHAPGAVAPYCNQGFGLAEMIVEHMSGKKYMNFLKTRIFTPLSLQNTDIGVGALSGKPVAYYYDPVTGKRHPLEVVSNLGSGGLSATAMDLCLFADAFAEPNKLLKKASLDEMKKAQPSLFKLQCPECEGVRGLGWDYTSLPKYSRAGIQVFGKSGGTGNYTSMLFTIPDKRIAVAVIISGSIESKVDEIALAILNAIMVEKQYFAKEESSIETKPIEANPELIPIKFRKIPKNYAWFNGYYAKGSTLVRVVFDFRKMIVNLYEFRNQHKAPTLTSTLIYNDGYFYDTNLVRYAFKRVNGEDYLLGSRKAFQLSSVTAQKIKQLPNPQNLKIIMDEKLWLRRNVYPYDAIFDETSHFVRSLLYKRLPGYVISYGINKIENSTFAGMPFDAIRDQMELTLFDKDDTVWMKLLDMIYSPASSAPELKLGDNLLKIASDGYSQWLVAHNDMIVNITKPDQGRIIVFLSDGTVTYDSAIDTGEVHVTKGCFIEFAGYAGDEFIAHGSL
jgi:CubicO group peptidase (beta-lactamase class C family)